MHTGDCSTVLAPQCLDLLSRKDLALHLPSSPPPLRHQSRHLVTSSSHAGSLYNLNVEPPTPAPPCGPSQLTPAGSVDSRTPSTPSRNPSIQKSNRLPLAPPSLSFEPCKSSQSFPWPRPQGPDRSPAAEGRPSVTCLPWAALLC